MSGYQHCACRDCFEIVIGDGPTYCDECIEEGCPDNVWNGECYRPDAYGCDCEEEIENA